VGGDGWGEKVISATGGAARCRGEFAFRRRRDGDRARARA
jgi:hypothetical protein